ncbi:MAG: nucleotidyltransferase domain-containing protein [Betaproteobacteria bacterium]|nr:nucleotidyltransferase domain-containing protein [Betaproteobacteria bacterium]
MGKSLSTAERARVIEALRAHGVVYALLFGSAARAELAYDSDIDVAVSAPGPLSGAQRYRLIGALAAATGRPIDLLDLRTARGAVFARALRGTELFCDSVRAKGDALYRRLTLIEEDLNDSRRSFAMARAEMFR